MIDNVILLITGTLHERDTHELLERCHPLGVFDTMPALCVATNVDELYQSVLVETPLGMFSPVLSRESITPPEPRIIRTHLARLCYPSMQTSRNRQRFFTHLRYELNTPDKFLCLQIPYGLVAFCISSRARNPLCPLSI